MGNEEWANPSRTFEILGGLLWPLPRQSRPRFADSARSPRSPNVMMEDHRSMMVRARFQTTIRRHLLPARRRLLPSAPTRCEEDPLLVSAPQRSALREAVGASVAERT